MGNPEEQSFEAMLESSMNTMGTLKPGQMLETVVVGISGDAVFIDLSGKSEGVLDAEELKDKEGELTVKVGDPIKAYFLNNKGGEYQFTTKIAGDKAGSDLLQQAYANGIPVDGVVEKEIKGGFEVKIGGTRAFCPFSQISMKRVEDASALVGKHMSFKIIEYKEGGRNILVSHRVILEAEHQEAVEVLKGKLQEGLVVKAVVKELKNFGAFVDIEGFQALLPISEVSRSRVNDLSKVLTVGQEIEASILSIDWDRERISVSMKALEADPWDSAEKKYPEGSKHEGTVVRLTDFGAFVNLEPGLDGLVHVSDLKGGRDNPKEILKKGQKINVEINSVDSDAQRISLKPADSELQDEAAQKYMGSNSDEETYNPFAALLKDKKKK